MFRLYSMRFAVTICLFLMAACASAQPGSIGYFNSDTFWQKLVYDTTIHTQQPQNAIIVASNRVYEKDSLRFMTQLRDGKSIDYFYVYEHNDKWYIKPAQSLEQAVKYMPANKDWVVYTEGMGKLFTTDIDRGMQLAKQYDVNILLLDYPSIRSDKKRLSNYYIALANSKKAHEDFVVVLDTVQQLRAANKMGKGNMSLLFHSMGNNVIREIVLNEKLQLINEDIWVDNIILNAPCVKQRKHARWVTQLTFAKNIYVHYNPSDYTLKGAHLLSMSKQLGERLKKPMAANAHYINFNTLVDMNHSNFLDIPGRNRTNPAALAHYDKLFHGETLQLDDAKYYAPTAYYKLGWDILPQKNAAVAIPAQQVEDKTTAR